MEKTIITNTVEETQQLGFDLSKKLQGGEVIALYGELGSGKTTFTQGLAKGLGITSRIISPTFIIMRSYKVRDMIQDSRFKNFYHVDLYRIETQRDIEELGLLELLGKKENVVVIEWPEKLSNLLPNDTKKIYFTYENDERRRITYA